MISDSSPLRRWRVKAKYGNKEVTVNVTTTTKDRAEEYARWSLRERGNLPIQILETTEKSRNTKK